MLSHEQLIEAVLFMSPRPLTIRKIASLVDISVEEVEQALAELEERLQKGSGLMLQQNDKEIALVTHPEASDVVKQMIKEDSAGGELSKASLEALTILAYRGPMTRPELEQVRGVQSALILRNLLVRGLVEQRADERLGQPVYAVTMDFLKHLGMARVEDLPDYEKLRGNAAIADVLNEMEAKNK